jgi:hypothetical protein
LGEDGRAAVRAAEGDERAVTLIGLREEGDPGTLGRSENAGE